MSDEVFLGGKQYVSSKRASDTSGYSRDYIGQLARGGLIDAQRVGGLWYISMESLSGYQRNAESFTPSIPPQKQGAELDTVVNFDGKEYVSASRASKITSYNQDYVGQLARSGKILSRQIGNRWYVERHGLLSHKEQKDRLLAAVQSEAVGLSVPRPSGGLQNDSYANSGPMLTYVREDNALMPVLNKREESAPAAISQVSRIPSHAVPIRIVRPVPSSSAIRQHKTPLRGTGRASRKTIFSATQITVALTFVIVLSYGFVSLKQNSLYTFNNVKGSGVLQSNAFTASAADAFTALGDIIEKWLSPEKTYIRGK